jgi:hypothetical protein
MKKQLVILSLSLTLVSALPALAVEKGNGPCQQIRQACESAGFKKGAHRENGKGLWIDCISKLKKGEAVEGVSVTSEQINACKERMEKRAEKRKARQEKKSAS